MSKPSSTRKKTDPTVKFLAQLAGISIKNFMALGNLPELPLEITSVEQLRMSGIIVPDNQPEFWADAPWRVEPDQREVPVTFYIRDAKSASPEKGSWRLDALRIGQLRDGEVWEKLHVYLPTDLSGLDSRGIIPQDFWFYTLHLPLEHMIQTQRGETIHVRVTFLASVYPYKKSISIDRYLDIFLSSHALPQGRASHQPGPRTWFYGDTHYHSSYTNDIKEFGAPLPETRLAGMGIGLDWIVVTDHSCDLDELDSDAEGKNRWERLKAEIVLPQLSDTNFRFILGEEITLVGKDEKYVHMLAIGNLQDLVPGAFLPYKSDRISVNSSFALLTKS